MKSWLISLFLCTITCAHADNSFFGEIRHNVIRDSFAQKGTISIQTLEISESEDLFEVVINYDLDVRVLIFNRNVKGSEGIKMPNSYRTEQGFLDLQRDGSYQDPRVTLTHKGRTNWGEFYDCHKVIMDPAEHNRWIGEFVYCPGAPKSGIIEMKLNILNIPLLGEGTVLSKWDRR